MHYRAILNGRPIGPKCKSDEAATMYLVRRMNALQGKGKGPQEGRVARVPDASTLEDPGTPGLFVIVWEGQLCSPTFNSKGAADACLAMYLSGARQPELRVEA